MSGNPNLQAPQEAAAVAAFVQHWQSVAGSELSNAQSFLIALCQLLGVAPPHATEDMAYMFERPITFHHGDGSTSPGRVDCYKRGHFVLESKRLASGRRALAAGTSTKAFDDALLRARQQAENYARALPASEGRPPLLAVVDVGHVIELYADFSRSGATYTPYPDARSHRIHMADLADAAIRARLRALWTDPLSLDPARASAKVTRAVAAELAALAKSLEAAGHPPQQVAAFLTRCLFSMFAEDVGLLPTVGENKLGGFTHLLTHYRERPDALVQMLKALWLGMDGGGFSAALGQDLMRFNGKLFKGAADTGYVLPLSGPQIDGLLRAARANWQEVEPAIFGTLLERALNPTERHALGAHYTPRAYVERLVLPTVMDPLRADWANAQAAALLLAREAAELEAHPPQRQAGSTHDTFSRSALAADNKALAEHERLVRAKWREARAEIQRFHHQLCSTRVLDPACGSGNFLYVTLEHLKRLEGEVLEQLKAFGDANESIGDLETVTLQQLLGIEINPRAAALAELVLWIGWLQWHVRTRGLGQVAEPVVHDYGNIDCRDAVLAYDRVEPALDAQGQVITRWDGKTVKKHPVTGEEVPDEAAQVLQWHYVNARAAEWPVADFIVGNPPFIGDKRLRLALGDGYVDALRSSISAVPESAEFVMYWWHHAASLVSAGNARRFGFISTNSLRQTFNRRVIETFLNAPKTPLRLAFAVPDHPWVDSAQGAAVRIAMSVVTAAEEEGRLLTVREERPNGGEEVEVILQEQRGTLHADLRLGANVAAAKSLAANAGISGNGVMLAGSGFILSKDEGNRLGLGAVHGLDLHIRHYRNGRDLMATSRDALVIDLYGLSSSEVRARFPDVFQWIVERVKPDRDQNNRARIRDNWWIFGEPRRLLRAGLLGLPRYIATVETAKHRAFQFLDAAILPDHMLIAIATSDALPLGVMSSNVHVEWSLATGSRLGVGNDPRYNKTRCFETFTFPSDDTGLTPELADHIRQLAEQLDAHRKARQAAHESVTLTGLYNLLAKLRRNEPLTAKDKLLHEQGLVSVLRSLHDELDAAVLQAYGWADLGPVPWADDAAHATWTDALLQRLVALNAQRAAEEAAGTVRWLRPEFQDPARRQAAAAAQSATPPTSDPNAAQQQAVIAGLADAAAADHAGDADADADDDGSPQTPAPTTAAAPPSTTQPWPPTLPEQVRAVAQLLSTSPAPLPLARIEAAFKGRGPWKKGLPRILDTLEALGRAQQQPTGWRG